jgi:hypothetical protein
MREVESGPKSSGEEFRIAVNAIYVNESIFFRVPEHPLMKYARKHPGWEWFAAAWLGADINVF